METCLDNNFVDTVVLLRLLERRSHYTQFVQGGGRGDEGAEATNALFLAKSQHCVCCESACLLAVRPDGERSSQVLDRWNMKWGSPRRPLELQTRFAEEKQRGRQGYMNEALFETVPKTTAAGRASP